MDKVVHKELSYILNGLFFKVHNDLGRFKNEKQYSDYFEKLLIDKSLSFLREQALDSSFAGEMPRRCICDFIVDDKIVVEFKAKSYITKDDYFQARRYLSSSKYELAILVNFRQTSLSIKRVLNTEIK